LSGRRQNADIADTLHLRDVAMATTFGFYIWGAHWRHLKNITEPSMCGGDAALRQITLTTCFIIFYCNVVFIVAPRPVHVSENMVSAIGGTVHLECQFRGVPTPSINWAKDSYTLWSTERVHVHGETVVIDGTVANDAGLYQCWADSDAGIEYAVIRLDVERLLTTVLPIVRPSGQLSYRGSHRVCRLI